MDKISVIDILVYKIENSQFIFISNFIVKKLETINANQNCLFTKF
jgi:hypothetical protein